MERRITLQSQEVQLFTPAVGIWSPLIVITTPQGTTYKYGYKNGQAIGKLWLLLKLFDNTGTQLPASTMLGIAKHNQGRSSFIETRIKEFPYAGYYDLSNNDQRAVQFEEQVYHELGVPFIGNPQYDQLILYINGPVVPVLTQPATLFETVAESTLSA